MLLTLRLELDLERFLKLSVLNSLCVPHMITEYLVENRFIKCLHYVKFVDGDAEIDKRLLNFVSEVQVVLFEGFVAYRVDLKKSKLVSFQNWLS